MKSSTFGTWNIIFSLLTKKIVQDIKEEESMRDVWLSRLAIESEEFLDVLTSKKLYGILMRAIDLEICGEDILEQLEMIMRKRGITSITKWSKKF